MSGICTLCPRNCQRDRIKQMGYCGAPLDIIVARAALHFWEEPCISGKNGSGAVFFSGCPLRCVYCQNREISFSLRGKRVSVEQLREIYHRLIAQGAENINLVTPTQYAPLIAQSLRPRLPVPVVYNTSGYEKIENLRLLEGLVDIYLPDYKYADPILAKKYSNAPDYPEIAEKAILEMVRQTGNLVFSEDGRLLRGVQIRHLVLPNQIENTYAVIDRISTLFPHGEAGFSLMSQYTPGKELQGFLELDRKLTREEYSRAVDYMYLCGIKNALTQELSSVGEEFIPDFDFTGLENL